MSTLSFSQLSQLFCSFGPVGSPAIHHHLSSVKSFGACSHGLWTLDFGLWTLLSSINNFGDAAQSILHPLSSILSGPAPAALAQLEAPLLSLNESKHEVLIMLGATAAVFLLIILWVVFIRRPGKEHKHHHHHHTHDAADTPDAKSEPEHKHRRHRRRRPHHKRNPTLAETGGLPPVRPHDTETNA
jgi:hypothetical protein